MLKRLLLCFLLLPLISWSQSFLKDDQQVLKLHNAPYQIYKDTSTIISHFSTVKEWKEVDGIEFINAKYFKHTIVKYQVYNESHVSREMILQANLHWESVVIYVNGKQVGKMGKTVKVSEKTIKANFQAVPIELAPKSYTEIILDVNSRLNYGTKLSLISPGHYIINNWSLQRNLSFFYGVIFILFLFNLIWYFLTKEKLRLAYSFYVFTIAYFSGKADGYLFHYLSPEYTEFLYYEYYLNKLVLAWGLGMFIYVYLSKNASNKISQRIILIALGIYTLQYIIELLVFDTSWYYHTMILVVWSFFIALFFSPNFIKKDYLLVIAVFFMCLGITTSILQSIYWRFFTTTFTVFATHYTFIIEALFFAIITAKKASDSAKEKINLQETVISQMQENESLHSKVTRELEQKVHERTQDLHQKNGELISLNEKLKKQSEQIMKMNEQLDIANFRLKKDNKEILKNTIVGVPISIEEVQTVFSNKLSCLNYLHQLKWEKGFVCNKCKNHTHKELPHNGGKRCSKCGTIETTTSKTVFERLRIPLEKAFYIAYMVYHHSSTIKATELADELEISSKTCYNFIKKCKTKIKEGRPKSLEDFLLNQ